MTLRHLSFLLAAILYSEHSSAEPADRQPPPVISGEVNDEAARFTFGSDAEGSSSASIINNWVCNKDAKSLLFIWEKARLSRGVWNPLGPGDCQEDPHPVAGIEAEPDYDAPIDYTQGQVRRTAAIYKPTTTFSKEARSEFRTRYSDPDGTKKDVVVKIGFLLDDNAELTLSVSFSPQEIGVALGNVDWLVAERYVAKGSAELVDMIYAAGGGATFDEAPKLFASDDLKWLPMSMVSGPILLIYSKGQSEFSVPVAVREEYASSLSIVPATLYIIDGKGRLVATGTYSQLSPKKD